MSQSSSRSTESVFGALVAISLSHFAVDFYMAFIYPILPQLSLELKISLTASGFLMTSLAVTECATQPLFGQLGDRLGRPWMLPAAIMWTALAMSSIAYARSYGTLLLLTVLSALGAAFVHPYGATLVHRMAMNTKGTAMSWYSAFGTAGYALGPLLVMPAVVRHGVSGLRFLLWPALLVVLMQVGLGVHKWDGARAAPVAERSAWGGSKKGAALVVLGTVAFLRAWAASAILGYAAFYFYALEYSETAVSWLLFGYLFAGALGGILAGAASDRIGRRMVLVGSGLLSTVATALFLLTRGVASWWWWLIAGAFTHAAFPVATVLAQELYPERSGMASGIIQGTAWGLGGLGVTLTGYIGDLYGMTTLLWSCVFLLAVSTLGCIAVSASTRPGKLKHATREAD
ncbi:MAG: MFS transporter [Bacillota bacterium]